MGDRIDTAPRGAWPGVALGMLLATLGVTLGTWVPSASSMPDSVRIPPVTARPSGTGPVAALFRHGTHQQTNCYGCHPSTFPRYPLGFTHAQMQAGEYCGSCHDGRAAFAVGTATCEACHVP